MTARAQQDFRPLPLDLLRLAEPFPPADLEWRIGQAGTKNGKVWATCLVYLTSRAIMQRLDDVVGPQRWRNELKEWGIGSPGVMCGIGIRMDDGEWVTKWDGADQPDTEPVKGGFSNALKRAAVLWGIGRYLYETPRTFALISDQGKHYQPAHAKKEIPAFKWDEPTAPLGVVADEDDDGNAAQTAAKPAPSRSATEGPTMPFGKTKGTLLSQMAEDDLRGALDWAVSKAKFVEFQAEARAELASRGPAEPDDEPPLDEEPPF